VDVRVVLAYAPSRLTIRVVNPVRGATIGNGPSRVLILTTYDLDRYVYAGLQAAAGQSVLAPEATTCMIEALQPLLPTDEDRALPEAADRLIEREREVCELIAEGCTVPTTGSYAPYSVPANADSPCSKAAGEPSSTSPSALHRFRFRFIAGYRFRSTAELVTD
jgi:hypothetical protein